LNDNLPVEACGRQLSFVDLASKEVLKALGAEAMLAGGETGRVDRGLILATDLAEDQLI
jgi:hypothetical protein